MSEEPIQFDREKETETAIKILKGIISKSIGKDVFEKDYKTAMQAQKELNRIFDVYSAQNDQEENKTDAKTEIVKELLQPLYPETEEVTELARKARAEIERAR